jgi:hypothetical protein
MQNKVAQVLGVSPAKASHLLKNYMPGMRGSVALDVPNIVAGQPEDPTAYRATGSAGLAQIAGFTRMGKSWDPWGPQSEHVKILMEFNSQVRTGLNEIARLKKIPGGQMAIQKYMAENPIMQIADGVQHAYKQMAGLRDWRLKIINNHDLTPEEQNIMLNYGADGDRGMGPDRLMTLHAIEANRAILQALTGMYGAKDSEDTR